MNRLCYNEGMKKYSFFILGRCEEYGREKEKKKT